MLVGLTGTFGSGKSTVLELFRKEGMATVSADRIVHNLFRQKVVREAIRKRFGSVVFNRGRVNRTTLAEIVFADTGKRKNLEGIIHPLVKKKIGDVRRESFRKKKMVVAEVPLLFESGMTKFFDRIVCVSAKPEIIQNRLQKKGVAESEVKKRSLIQWRLSRKEKKSGVIIDNNGSLIETRKQVRSLLDKLQSTKTG